MSDMTEVELDLGATCLICKDFKENQQIVWLTNSAHVYCKTCMLEYVKYSNLAIDLEMSDLNEWLITAQNDTYNNSNATLRFRNPLTNISFSVQDLTAIFNCYNKKE